MDHPVTSVMREAIDIGLETGAVGAVVVGNGDVLARSTGAIFDRPDATAHSETEAIREACQSLGSVRLEGCWLYTTHEPCPMCTAACCWARLDGVVYAATGDDMPDEWETIFSELPAREVRDACEHRPELVEEFMRAEATRIHREHDR